MGIEPKDKHILLVDDDMGILQTLGEILTDSGHRVVCAANGQEALDMLAGMLSLPHLIITDLMMPQVNGWELRHRLCTKPRWSSIPVLILSSEASALQPEAWPNGEAPDGFLRKPFALSHFLRVVDSLLRVPLGAPLANDAVG